MVQYSLASLFKILKMKGKLSIWKKKSGIFQKLLLLMPMRARAKTITALALAFAAEAEQNCKNRACQ